MTKLGEHRRSRLSKWTLDAEAGICATRNKRLRLQEDERLEFLLTTERLEVYLDESD